MSEFSASSGLTRRDLLVAGMLGAGAGAGLLLRPNPAAIGELSDRR
jgi:hypothetical protein